MFDEISHTLLFIYYRLTKSTYNKSINLKNCYTTQLKIYFSSTWVLDMHIKVTKDRRQLN